MIRARNRAQKRNQLHGFSARVTVKSTAAATSSIARKPMARRSRVGVGFAGVERGEGFRLPTSGSRQPEAGSPKPFQEGRMRDLAAPSQKVTPRVPTERVSFDGAELLWIDAIL